MLSKLYHIFYLLLLVSCSPRNLTYFSDLDSKATNVEYITNSVEPKIQPNDILSISLTSLSTESNILFNSGVIQTSSSSGSSSSKGSTGYMVNKDGYIIFPVIGKIRLAGLTKDEATAKMTNILGKYVREPIVDINFTNFKITVIGEVSNPSTFTVPTERINILEALGLAGDMTAYGKRENVLIIREQSGQRTTTRLNLNDKDILNSPYFYLQQNDIVYVEPDKAKAIQVSMNRANVQYGLSVGLALLSVVTILITQVL